MKALYEQSGDCYHNQRDARGSIARVVNSGCCSISLFFYQYIGPNTTLFGLQLSERAGSYLAVRLRSHGAGCIANSREDDRYRGDALHLQRPAFQVGSSLPTSHSLSLSLLIVPLLSVSGVIQFA